ncbi:serine/threonine protein kinase [Desulforapulum autotrophicum HRM2]|uniref:Serine/threonine protein kinase n=1 Tax=Desulforapulum autotrophicum (strain ATCC 43914 / DSM 3382 / VKM B-1955 / HRM2) TaxID=177437 RepID=C0QLM6_DESAH|nr:protein kinase [Desulforapulum autotrophicum]ACN16330.1 serine/threonine protein kinase [Desulforapulum autotrophicum HRM2]
MKYIGKFKVAGLLGKGGMGKVFKVEYPVTGKIGALKLLEPVPLLTTLMGEKGVEDLFVAEAVTLASLRHPHVVEILDFDRFEGKPFYTMGFYSNNLGALMGESYETERPSRVIKIERSVGYILQILDGLACLHDRSVIHRDIKPFNILLDDLDNVKICDFGLSKLRNETFHGHASLKVGSPYYASPEQEKDPDGVDETADLYSVGVMLFRMLTGKLPEKKSRASELNSDLDPTWDDFFDRAMAFLPGHRFPDADSMAEDLKGLCLAWIEKKEKFCSVSMDWLNETEPFQRQIKVRHLPEKIPRARAQKAFDLDSLMRPRQILPKHFKALGSDLVKDPETGLVWQSSGTRFPVNWKEGCAYVQRLNRERYQGFDNWRMPTAAELLTIISPLPKGTGLCLEPVFDLRQHWLWSADRATFTSAWYASLELGFIDSSDLSSYYHVKAVCTPPGL